METLAILVNAVLVLGVGSVLTYLAKDRFAELQGQIGGVRTDVRDLRSDMVAGFKQVRSEMNDLRVEVKDRSEIHDLRTEMSSELGKLRSEVSSEIGLLRSDVTHIALAVGARRRPDAG